MIVFSTTNSSISSLASDPFGSFHISLHYREAEIGQYSLRSVFSEWPFQSEVTEEVEVTTVSVTQFGEKIRPKYAPSEAEMNLDELNKLLQSRIAEKLGETVCFRP